MRRITLGFWLRLHLAYRLILAETYFFFPLKNKSVFMFRIFSVYRNNILHMLVSLCVYVCVCGWIHPRVPCMLGKCSVPEPHPLPWRVCCITQSVLRLFLLLWLRSFSFANWMLILYRKNITFIIDLVSGCLREFCRWWDSFQMIVLDFALQPFIHTQWCLFLLF